MREHFFNGIKAALPAALGCIPVGISIGLLAVQADIGKIGGTVMSLLVMAGSSELMAIGMLASGASLFTIILGTFFINLRHLVMSASVWRKVPKASLLQRLTGSFALCDESFAVYSLSEDDNYFCLLGANTVIYTFFVISTAAGCFLSDILPEIVIDSFGIAFYAAFLGLLLPSVKGNNPLFSVVVVTALLNLLLSMLIPASWAVIVSMLAGVLLGVYFVPDNTKGEPK